MKLRHIKTGNEGSFVREFKASGRPYYSTIILLFDGREYVAPSYEFEVIGDFKYIKRGYITNKVYMKVFSQDSNFYKGLRICFNKKETEVIIDSYDWFDFKPTAYITEQITEDDFTLAFSKACEILKSKYDL